MDTDQVKKLAVLARIELSDEEVKTLTHEFKSILDYVGEVQGAVKNGSADLSHDNLSYPQRNVMRDDENAHEKGVYTKDLLKLAPTSDGKYIKVKKIL